MAPWRKGAFLAPCLLLIMATHASAQSPADSHARLELIAEQNSAPPGRPLWVGVLFRLDEGWHIYWQNPGDSGEPPKIQWQLPAGFAAGTIRWPQPIRLGGGTVVDYGYEGQVLLVAPIEGASDGRATSMPSLSADVKYIVCREMCIPGKAHLTLTPPPGGDWGKWRALFEQTRQQLPKPAPPGWKVSVESDKFHFIVSVRTGSQVQSASFFPINAGEIDNSSAQDFTSNRTGFRLTLKKSDQLSKPISTLKGLIVLGPGRAFEVATPVVSR
ncbi:MAG: protein-disulfide reductase DsbD domain-containing protein [Candidatus Korobacteraceae bacterium]